MSCCVGSEISVMNGGALCCPRTRTIKACCPDRTPKPATGLFDWALLLATGVTIGLLAVLRIVETIR